MSRERQTLFSFPGLAQKPGMHEPFAQHQKRRVSLQSKKSRPIGQPSLQTLKCRN
jgi:hypothetical protein